MIMNKILILFLVVLIAGGSVIISADAIFSSIPLLFEQRLLGEIETTLDAHAATLSIPEQQDSLNTIEIHIGLLQDISFSTVEFQSKADTLLIRAINIFELGIIKPETVTEFKNVDGRVILTIFEGEDKLLFIVNNIYDFKCTTARTISNGETIITATCPEK